MSVVELEPEDFFTVVSLHVQLSNEHVKRQWRTPPPPYTTDQFMKKGILDLGTTVFKLRKPTPEQQRIKYLESRYMSNRLLLERILRHETSNTRPGGSPPWYVDDIKKELEAKP